MDVLHRRRLLLAAAAAIIVDDLRQGNERRRRRVWAREWLKRRVTGQGLINMVHRELRMEDVRSYRNFLRMDEAMYTELLAKVSPIIQKKNTVMRQCITADERLSVTLRFLATGETFKNLHFSSRMASNTISGIVAETLSAIVNTLEDELKAPTSVEEWKIISDQFLSLWNFPHCLGALDGKHIAFTPPRASGSYYRNYKGTDSIVLLALADANCRFVWVNVGVNGRANDASIYNASNLKRALDNNLMNLPPASPLPNGTINVPYVIIADDAFPLDWHLMKPFRLRELTNQRRHYNYRLSRARRVVENAFGLLANKFRVLLTKINLSPEKVDEIVASCCLLHNFILNRKPIHLGDEDTERVQNLQPIRCLIGGNRARAHVYSIREEFVKYFNGVGRVPWQDEAVNRGNM